MARLKTFDVCMTLLVENRGIAPQALAASVASAVAELFDDESTLAAFLADAPQPCVKSPCVVVRSVSRVRASPRTKRVRLPPVRTKQTPGSVTLYRVRALGRWCWISIPDRDT